MRQKRVVAVHDISCVGRCSLTVALPVLSAAGIETSVIPTAVLSTHTGEFEGYSYRDLSSDIPKIVTHWQTLGLSTDAFYTGYLASEQQVDMVCDLIDRLKDNNSLVFIDPVMADNGKLYTKFDNRFPQKMRLLCSKANIIVPNMTEAALLLDEEPQKTTVTEAEIKSRLKRLSALGPKRVIITGYTPDNAHLGAVAYNAEKDEYTFAVSDKVEGFYYGTGDLFASALLGALLNGKDDNTALQIAVNYTEQSILRTKAEGRDVRYGVNFEQGLGDYIKALQ